MKQMRLGIIPLAVILTACASRRAAPTGQLNPPDAQPCIPSPEAVVQIAASAESAELLKVFTALLAEAKKPLTPAQIIKFRPEEDWNQYFDPGTIEKYLPALLKAYEKMHALCHE